MCVCCCCQVRKMIQQQLAESTQRNVDMWAGREMENRFKLDTLQREAKNLQVVLGT
jgi:hypothetical protein